MLNQLFNKYKSVISYLFWGVVTTIVNIGVFAILSDYLHLFYQVSNVIAWFVSVLVAYVVINFGFLILILKLLVNL